MRTPGDRRDSAADCQVLSLGAGPRLAAQRRGRWCLSAAAQREAAGRASADDGGEGRQVGQRRCSPDGTELREEGTCLLAKHQKELFRHSYSCLYVCKPAFEFVETL